MEEVKVMQETRVIQEATLTTGAKPQIEVQPMEHTIISSETVTIIQPIKHPTMDPQMPLNKGEECGALSAQDLSH